MLRAAVMETIKELELSIQSHYTLEYSTVTEMHIKDKPTSTKSVGPAQSCTVGVKA